MKPDSSSSSGSSDIARRKYFYSNKLTNNMGNVNLPNIPYIVLNSY